MSAGSILRELVFEPVTDLLEGRPLVRPLPGHQQHQQQQEAAASASKPHATRAVVLVASLATFLVSGLCHELIIAYCR